MNLSKNSAGSAASGGGHTVDYYIKRQKNNEAAKISRLRKKEHEIQLAEQKRRLEIAYVKLQKQINYMQSVIRA